MKIIDFRYRPSTRASLDSVIKNPVYAEYIKRTDFCTRPEKSLDECVTELRSLDVVKAVVSGRDIESTYAIGSTNESVLECMARDPDLFIGFWAYDPHKGMQAVRRFRKAVTEEGIRGAAIDAAMAHCAVSDAKFYPLYAMCCEFDIPVIMTAGLSPFMPKIVLESTNPAHVDQVATDFPELKIILSHGGYPWVLETISLVLRHTNVYMDISTCEKKLMGDQYIRAANEYITDKVVFASANPFVEVAQAVKNYEKVDFTEECRRKLYYENGARLLGLEGLL